MSIPDDSSVPGLPKEWWEKVTLDDVAGCAAAVKDFLNDAEPADVSQLSMTLPLFIVCGGDHAGITNKITSVTERICREAVPAKDSICIQNWLDRLYAISNSLLLVPDPYSEEIAEIRESARQGIFNGTQAVLKIKIPPNKFRFKV